MPKIFSTARDASAKLHFTFALLQTAPMWTVFLVVIPSAILWAQGQLGIPRFDAGISQTPIAVAFTAIGLVGIYCAWLFARDGKGTPAPFASPSRLVIRGPYRYVRNPMAIGGIAQGVLVGVFLGSWPVILYSLVGAFAWHAIARPAEERDLTARHGAAYEQYVASVRCWLPRSKPYEAEP